MGFLLIIVYCLFLKNELFVSSCIESNIFDYIVVGAGSSGAVVATRLSENKKDTVLLLEAGKEPLPESLIPLTGFRVLQSEMNWNYTTVPQKNGGYLFNNNIIPLAKGKALGGSSSISRLEYTRGNKLDYDLWHQQGNVGWKYSNLYRYFLKLEDYAVPRSRFDDDYHHEGGSMSVELSEFKTPLADAFLRAGLEIGQPLVDYNAKYQSGFMTPPFLMKDGTRCSTYTCYLEPVMKRFNLVVLTNAFVTKILTNNLKIATGVRFKYQNSECFAEAKKEIIISAGAIRSPQLLMLSGIGPRDTLEQFKIPLVKHLPGVGKNLRDHPVLTGLAYEINQTISYNTILQESKKYLELWETTKTGPMTCPSAIEGIAFYQCKTETDFPDWPDIEVEFYSATASQIVAAGGSITGDQISFLPFLLRPKSHGEVTLSSANPFDAPLIDPKYLSHPKDINGLIVALNFIRKIVQTKAFSKYGATLVKNRITDYCNSITDKVEDFAKCIVRGYLNAGSHFSSTCKMGPKKDPMAVVDARLRVYGVQSLRIVDASIMPTLVSGHLTVPCMMIAEKAADMIKQDNAV